MMRILTVRQPWAWAIIHGGKDVENRVRNLAGEYRGPVAIHAGLADFEQGNLASRRHRELHGTETDTGIVFGGIIGVVDLVDVHTADDTGRTGTLRGIWPRCSPWAERAGVHLVLANPRALRDPIPYRGALHLQTASPELETQILRSLA